MENKNVTRRDVLTTAAIGTALADLPRRGYAAATNDSGGLPAILGGKPVRTTPFPRWPIFREADEKAVLPVLRSGVWSRAKVVAEAERRYARLMGAKYCIATSNGTNAIITAVRGLDIGAGDEVITTPYTFAATIHPILLPTPRRSLRISMRRRGKSTSSKIEAKITRTRSHSAGSSAASAYGSHQPDRKKHNLKVIEDACEARWEWKSRKVGTPGTWAASVFRTASP
jgi:dTDP-4-amino-4,6-dideoxygalactose transaminase